MPENEITKSVIFSQEDIAVITEAAKKEGRNSFSNQVRYIVKQWIASQPKPKKTK